MIISRRSGRIGFRRPWRRRPRCAGTLARLVGVLAILLFVLAPPAQAEPASGWIMSRQSTAVTADAYANAAGEATWGTVIAGSATSLCGPALPACVFAVGLTGGQYQLDSNEVQTAARHHNCSTVWMPGGDLYLPASNITATPQVREYSGTECTDSEDRPLTMEALGGR